MQAEAKLTNIAQDVYADQTQNAYKIKVFETKEDIKNSRRKAGGIAAIGKIAAAGFLSASDNTKDRKYPTADRTGFDSAYQSDVKKLLADNKAKREALYSENDSTSQALRSSFSTPNTSDANGAKSGKAPSADGPLVSSAQALAAGKGTAGQGGQYNLQQMTDLAIQGGFTPENARIMAAISKGESGGNAGIDTVQSGLDPNKSNEYSIGLSQINLQAHGDKLSRRGWTEADLRDPVKNMTIAKEVYDEVGSFRPWSVYQKGLHQQYLN